MAAFNFDTLTWQMITGHEDGWVLLGKIALQKKYVDNKPTDEIETMAFDCICPFQGCSQLRVKIPIGLMEDGEPISAKDIRQARCEHRLVLVRFADFEGRLYTQTQTTLERDKTERHRSENAVSATASGVEVTVSDPVLLS